MPDLVPVDYDPFSAEQAGAQWLAGKTGQVLGGLAQQAWNTPLDALTASEQLRTTGDYDPAPVVNAALMGMTGGVAGVPMEAGEAALGSGPIRAYHGSPYDFDQFDLSKIGTGEGAQAYGHGLYFAENPSVAGSYKTAGARSSNIQFEGNGLANIPNDRYAQLSPVTKQAVQWLKAYQDIPTAIRDSAYSDVPGLQDELTRLDKAGKLSNLLPGRMYEVNIAADPEHFLDWDKPLSEQPQKVQELFEPFRQGTVNDWSTNPTLGEPTHASQVIANHQMNGKGAELTEALRQAGIPGIKYLDQGSRGVAPRYTVFDREGNTVARGLFDAETAQRRAQEVGGRYETTQAPQTSNYVVFDPSIISIIKKYGLAGLIAGGAAHFSTSPVDHNPYEGSQ